MDFSFAASLLDRLRTARRLVALTGAGISAESGVPTFRQAQTGLWAQYDPTELATPEAFRRNPRLVWEWYAWRRELVARVAPNAGHRALVEIERRVPAFLLVTQNVDGLHRVAGSQKVVELHGNLQRTRCSQEGIPVEAWGDADEIPPRCPRCGSLLRPDVVWFGEALPPAEWEQAARAARACDLFLSIGTSALVQPAASLPLVARDAGAVVVEVNPQQTPLTPLAEHALSGPAGQVLPALVHAAWPPAPEGEAA